LEAAPDSVIMVQNCSIIAACMIYSPLFNLFLCVIVGWTFDKRLHSWRLAV